MWQVFVNERSMERSGALGSGCLLVMLLVFGTLFYYWQHDDKGYHVYVRQREVSFSEMMNSFDSGTGEVADSWDDYQVVEIIWYKHAGEKEIRRVHLNKEAYRYCTESGHKHLVK